MARFVGRVTELGVLRRHLQVVTERGTGVFLSVRGRRQVGKSRLVEEFLHGIDNPSVFFAATKGAGIGEQLQMFAAEVAQSPLEAAPFFADVTLERWEPALRLLAANVTRPCVVVLDELPFLLESDPSLEGTLQKTWDRHLSRVPILLVGVGSDLSTMEMLGQHDRPLYQRLREMIVEPFTVAETADMLGLDPADAFDAFLVLGGFPKLAEDWDGARNLRRFLRAHLAESTSPLVVVGERILTAEFPPGLQAREVLQVIGGGATTFATIAARTGINQGSLTRSLQVLVADKRVVAVDRPLSARPTRNALYRVADPYLRFWLRFIHPNMEMLLRGRGDRVAARIGERWAEYRGRAIEPVVRASIERLLPDPRFGEALHVGGYWSRTGDVEVDLVGANRPRSPADVSFVGSIKWRERSLFDRRDLAALASLRARVPGAENALIVGVSRSGFSTQELDVACGPDDLIAAWSTSTATP